MVNEMMRIMLVVNVIVVFVYSGWFLSEFFVNKKKKRNISF